MIRLIVGLKGSGKTTRLIEMVNEAVAAEKGDVICVEKTTKLNNDLDRRVAPDLTWTTMRLAILMASMGS